MLIFMRRRATTCHWKADHLRPRTNACLASNARRQTAALRVACSGFYFVRASVEGVAFQRLWLGRFATGDGEQWDKRAFKEALNYKLSPIRCGAGSIRFSVRESC